jgi:hypothetical protein
MGNLNPLPCPFGQVAPSRRGRDSPVPCHFTSQVARPYLLLLSFFSKTKVDLFGDHCDILLLAFHLRDGDGNAIGCVLG